MKIEIVVPTINLWNRYTKQAVNSLMDAMVRAKAHNIDCHILLIDNGSTDETKTEAPKMNSELFFYQRNEERWGFSKSVNFGVKYGFEHGADYVLVCNNDIMMHPEAIWRLVERFEGKDVGMVTCMDITGEMRQFGIQPMMIGTLNAKDKESCEETIHPNFSAFMVSKQCWEDVGEFDEEFAPAYYEDNDYHYRMNLVGVPAITWPPAMFYHFASRTQLEANENGQPIISHGSFENNKGYMMRKWGSLSAHEIKFTHPFNDETKSVKYTKQNPI